MIRFLKYPTAAVEEAATGYWQTHQDDMLLDLYMNEHVKDCLEKLEAQEDTRFHRQRNISKAVNESGAKSVNVTIQRDGKDFTFKYPAIWITTLGICPQRTERTSEICLRKAHGSIRRRLRQSPTEEKQFTKLNLGE